MGTSVKSSHEGSARARLRTAAATCGDAECEEARGTPLCDAATHLACDPLTCQDQYDAGKCNGPPLRIETDDNFQQYCYNLCGCNPGVPGQDASLVPEEQQRGDDRGCCKKDS